MANGYYTHTTYPGTNAAGASAAMRAELDAVMAGFSLLPDPLGSGQHGFSGGNWLNPIIAGGSIDGTSIGATSRGTGKFSTLDANDAVSFTDTVSMSGGGSMAGTFTGTPTFSDAIIFTKPVINGGTIDGAPIGGTTRAAGAFTTLAANGAVTLSAGGTLTGTFTGGTFSGSTYSGGTITGAALTGDTIDSSPVGGTTPAAGKFTTLASTGVITVGADGSTSSTSRDALTGAQVRGLAYKVGEVRMWHGAVASIAATWGTGWQLADGTNGTANLRDRFIVGAGSTYAVNATGGNSMNVLVTANLPSHNHPFSDPGHVHGYGDPGHLHGVPDPGHVHGVNDPGHAHSITIHASEQPQSGTTTPCWTTSVNGSTSGAFTGISIAGAFTGIGATDTRGVGLVISGALTGASVGFTGSASAVENKPPYYALCYIEYTGIGA